MDPLVSRNLVGRDDEILLLDGQGPVAKGRVMPHLTLGVEAVQVWGREGGGGREGGREGGWISWSGRRESSGEMGEGGE